MKRLDLVIDALDDFLNSTDPVDCYKLTNALAVARALRELEPVATRNGFSGVIEVEWGKSVPIGTKLYALGDEK